MKRLVIYPLYLTPFLLVAVSWLLYPDWIYSQYIFGGVIENKSFVTELGTFGDVYGSLNTLFSGLAFAGVILSIRLQSAELKETRTEMAHQSKQFESQANALDKQVFENTFFQLLEFNNSIISLASIDERAPLLRNGRLVDLKGDGRHVFKQLYFYLIESLRNNYIVDSGEIYEEFHVQFGDSLGHYFRNIYQIIKFVDASKFSYQEKKYYSNILRAQLSKYEVGLLFYNCLSSHGKDKFKPLLEEYEFFEHLAEDLGAKYMDVLSYKISVFGWSNRFWFKQHILSKAMLVKEHPNEYSLFIYRDGFSTPERLDNFEMAQVENDVFNNKVIWMEYEKI